MHVFSLHMWKWLIVLECSTSFVSNCVNSMENQGIQSKEHFNSTCMKSNPIYGNHSMLHVHGSKL